MHADPAATPDLIERMRARVAAGAERAGRSLDEIELCFGTFCHVTDDEREAARIVKPYVVAMAQVGGRETLRFGPMKPMGLTDPRSGRRPYAVVQLRAENARCGSFNLVGFQNHLRFDEQQRVLRMIPGLADAE